MTPQAVVDRIIALVSASRDEEALAFWAQCDRAMIEEMTGEQLDAAIAYLSSATYCAEVKREAAAAQAAD